MTAPVPSPTGREVIDTTPVEYLLKLARGHAERYRAMAVEYRAGLVAHVPAGSIWAEHYGAECDEIAARHDARADELQATISQRVAA